MGSLLYMIFGTVFSVLFAVEGFAGELDLDMMIISLAYFILAEVTEE